MVDHKITTQQSRDIMTYRSMSVYNPYLDHVFPRILLFDSIIYGTRVLYSRLTSEKGVVVDATILDE